jgi:hypothetical protein
MDCVTLEITYGSCVICEAFLLRLNRMPLHEPICMLGVPLNDQAKIIVRTAVKLLYGAFS